MLEILDKFDNAYNASIALIVISAFYIIIFIFLCYKVQQEKKNWKIINFALHFGYCLVSLFLSYFTYFLLFNYKESISKLISL